MRTATTTTTEMICFGTLVPLLVVAMKESALASMLAAAKKAAITERIEFKLEPAAAGAEGAELVMAASDESSTVLARFSTVLVRFCQIHADAMSKSLCRECQLSVLPSSSERSRSDGCVDAYTGMNRGHKGRHLVVVEIACSTNFCVRDNRVRQSVNLEAGTEAWWQRVQAARVRVQAAPVRVQAAPAQLLPGVQLLADSGRAHTMDIPTNETKTEIPTNEIPLGHSTRADEPVLISCDIKGFYHANPRVEVSLRLSGLPPNRVDLRMLLLVVTVPHFDAFCVAPDYGLTDVAAGRIVFVFSAARCCEKLFSNGSPYENNETVSATLVLDLWGTVAFSKQVTIYRRADETDFHRALHYYPK